MALLARVNYQYQATSDSYIYVTRIVERGKIEGDDLVSEAAEDSTISKATMRAAAAALALQFNELLFRGYAVELPGVGTFRVSGSATAMAALDNAGADTVYRRRVLYTPCSSLKAALYDADLTTEYGNQTSGIYKSRSAYAAALGVDTEGDSETDEGTTD